MTDEEELLKTFEVYSAPPLYLVGSFDRNVTVLSQQIRALNLAYCLVETGLLPKPKEERIKLAIIGAGFAGLTLAAALLKKEAAVDITIFEERDTLLPLQQGSDTRWLHPYIYDWPAPHSEMSAAMLPVLNWTAARASDVVVQVLGEWSAVVAGKMNVQLFCNTRHIQIRRSDENYAKAQVEWIGEIREPSGGQGKGVHASGTSEPFDAVVMTVGFGLEKAAKHSYWRNETLGQPSLIPTRAMYLVSGEGDGAMIDLLRLRISQYRQDRILEELFANKPDIRKRLGEIKDQLKFLANGDASISLFSEFNKLSEAATEQWENLISELSLRLRRDTDAVLRLEHMRNLSALIQPNAQRRMSFQNALLVFLLYRCGGFTPSNEKESELCSRFDIPEERVIRRHGPDKRGQFSRFLACELDGKINENSNRQSAEVAWPGGYFGVPGPKADARKVADQIREGWRKEYLPGPTSLLATVLAGAVAALVGSIQPQADHFRVTVHRVLDVHTETVLQQACEYAGRIEKPKQLTSGRTFPASMATIGQAFSSRKPIRSRVGVSPEQLQGAMAILNLEEGAREMRPHVHFVLALPIVQPDHDFYGPSPVSGIVYVDSSSAGFWLTDENVSEIGNLVQDTLKSVVMAPASAFNRLRNFPIPGKQEKEEAAGYLDPRVLGEMEVVEVDPPRTSAAFQFNFEYSDLTPIVQVPSNPLSSA